MKNLRRFVTVSGNGLDDAIFEYRVPVYDDMRDIREHMSEHEIIQIVNDTVARRMREQARSQLVYQMKHSAD